MRYRSRAALAAGVGAFIGLTSWIDARMIGPERYAELQDLSISAEYAGSFAWQVGGGAAFCVIVYLLVELGAWLSDIYARSQVDRTHAHHCMHRERRFRKTHQCTCDATPANWSPERRRQAFRSISGGKP